MATFARLILVAVIGATLGANRASAGMPSFTLADVPRAVRTVGQTGLTDLARQRLEVVSFFLLGLLVCAGVVRWVWNGLRNDFAVLPRLSYARALGFIVVWGLLFVLVLTMISGARELMTPGAWEKKGLTNRLVQPPLPPIEAEITARYEAIRRLEEWLVDYAQRHQGACPAPEHAGDVPERLWRVPARAGGRYVYVGGRMGDSEHPSLPAPLAYEPESVGPDRLVLMTTGMIQWMPAAEIERLLSSRKP
jgi:hypothetical protein